MKKNKAMQLVKALRSGEYHQGKGQLVDDDDNFCCLGVACNISKTDLQWEKISGPLWVIGNATITLPKKIRDEFGFCSLTGRRRDNKFLTINNQQYLSLVIANDQGCSFDQIADYIEENWEAL